MYHIWLAHIECNVYVGNSFQYYVYIMYILVLLSTYIRSYKGMFSYSMYISYLLANLCGVFVCLFWNVCAGKQLGSEKKT